MLKIVAFENSVHLALKMRNLLAFQNLQEVNLILKMAASVA